jgi:anti-anti-sigma factor
MSALRSSSPQPSAVRVVFTTEQLAGGEVCAIAVSGEVDLVTAPHFRRQLDASPTRTVLVDLSEVTFLDSSTVHVLLEARKRLDVAVVRRPGGAVAQVLDMTAIPRVIPVHDDRESALRHLV